MSLPPLLSSPYSGLPERSNAPFNSQLRMKTHLCAKARIDMLGAVAAKMRKISVLLEPDGYERFESYCRTKGHKKSTLVSKLIRDFLDNEQGPATLQMPNVGINKKRADRA